MFQPTPPSRTLVDCGCVARVHTDGSGVELDFCPLHEAAPDLLAALQGCMNLLREVYGMVNPEAIGNETLEDWLKEAKVAIAKADARP